MSTTLSIEEPEHSAENGRVSAILGTLDTLEKGALERPLGVLLLIVPAEAAIAAFREPACHSFRVTRFSSIEQSGGLG